MSSLARCFYTEDGKLALLYDDIASCNTTLHLRRANASFMLHRVEEEQAYSTLDICGRSSLSSLTVFLSPQQLRQLRDAIDAHLAAEYPETQQEAAQ